MMSHLHVDNEEYWREIVCAQVMEAAPADIPPDFCVDMDTFRRGEIQISRIRSVPHRWQRLEKHVRHSRHTDFVVYLQTKGSIVQVQDGREILLRQGEITCKDATRPMAMKLNEDFEQVLIHIPRSVVLSAFGTTECFTSRELGKPYPLGSVVSSFLWSLGSALGGLSSSAADSISTTAESLVMALLAEQGSVTLNHPNWGEDALRYRAEQFIRSHSQHANLTPKTVALALNVSLRSLQGAFHIANTTPSEYIWESRLRQSKQDLTNSTLAPLNISDMLCETGSQIQRISAVVSRIGSGWPPRDYRAWKGSKT
jgi:AraC-like DNA-binding protein